MSDLFTASPLGWVLLFALGLRHGLDPDHIAVIDGLALGADGRGRAAAGWTGLVFSAGHGLSFTATAVAAALVGSRLSPSPAMGNALDWLSIAVLTALGVANLVALRRPGDYRPAGWRAGWVRGLSGRGLIAALGAGVVFGLMFETAVQAAALGAAASALGGVGLALGVSLVFDLGMSMTDGLDGLLLARALRARGAEGARAYRRVVGWLVVALAFGMAGVEILSKISVIKAEDSVLTWLGAAAGVAAVGASALFTRRRRAPMSGRAST